MSIRHSLIIIIVIAFITRIIASIWSFGYRDNTDVLRYKDWARISYVYGLSETYRKEHITFGTLPNNQPPGLLYILSTSYRLHIQLSKVLLRFMPHSEEVTGWLNGPVMSFMLRLPSIVSDCIIGILIFLFVMRYNKKRGGFIASALYLFNPVVIYNSAVWGQVDSIINMFFLLSLWMLYKKHMFISMTLLCFSILTKFSLLFIVPFYFLLWYKEVKSRWDYLYAAGLACVTGILFTFPISTKPIHWLIGFIQQNATGEMTNITAFAMNIWWVIFRPFITIGNPNNLFSFSEVRLINSPESSLLWFGIPLFVWAVALFIACSIPLYFAIYKNKKSNTQHIFIALACYSLLAFTFLPQMHERYMYPAFVLLAISLGFAGNLVIPYVIVTVLNMINVYIVWHPMPVSFFPYQIWTEVWFQWTVSLCTVIVACVVYIQTLRFLYEKR